MEIKVVFGTEIEIKLNLQNELNYIRLIEHFGEKIVQIKQENYFYDTPNKALSKADWVLRIRRTESEMTATLKGKAIKNNDGLTVRPEFNELISSDLAADDYESSVNVVDLPANITSLVKNLTITERLERTVLFVNYRTKAILNEKDIEVTFEIDKTIYADGSTDYELEIELTDKKLYDSIVTIVKNLFEKLAIPFQTQEESKYARALVVAMEEWL